MVMHAVESRRDVTLEDLLAIPEAERFHEIIDGELVRRAQPSGRHGLVQLELGSEMSAYYGPRSRGRGPGGWLFASEVDIHFDPRNILRPDLAGWRRERMQSMSGEIPLMTRPDWVCEISSASNKQNDLFRKFRVYQRCGVTHYWIIDPELWSLTVYRWTEAGYLVAQTAQGDESLRAEPFPVVELYIPEFFLDEPATGPALFGSHRDAHPG